MLVEFTGITCSGKTTVSLLVIDELKRAGVDLYSVHSRKFDMAGQMAPLFSNETLQNLFMDFSAFLRISANPCTYSRLLGFSTKAIMADGDTSFHKMNRFRSVFRKVGINHILRQRDRSGSVIIIDEGIIHSIHNLFVQPSSLPDRRLLEDYSAKLPLPDIIIYVKSPVETLVERALNRKDVPRRTGRDNLVKFIYNAQKVYDIFMDIDVIKRRSLVVMNDGADPRRLSDIVVKHITGYLK